MSSPTWPQHKNLRAADLQGITRDPFFADADYKSASDPITNTSYTNVFTPCILVFTAKASGMILLGNCAVLKNSVAGRTLMSYQIRADATIAVGTVVQAPSDSNALYVIGTDERTASRVELLTGFTPGVTYNVQQHIRVSSGTGTCSNKSMFVLPV
jgi:hypothetical protein